MLDGHRVRGYAGAFEINGHVFAPVRPYVTRIADRVYYAGGRLAIVRGSRIVYIRMPERAPDALDRSYVPLSSVVTALGAGARYLGSAHILEVRLPPERTVGSPEPFDPCAPQATPNAVFTPAPVATARPVYSGSPLPRRTPLPYARPTPKNSATPAKPGVPNRPKRS